MKTLTLFNRARSDNGLGVQICFNWSEWFGCHLIRRAPRWCLHVTLFGLQMFLVRGEYPANAERDYGFSVGADRIALYWGAWRRYLDQPWNCWYLARNQLMLEDGSFVDRLDRHWLYGLADEPMPRNVYQRTLPYRYVERCGAQQDCQATFVVERRVWRLWWMPLISRTKNSLWVEFSAAVGESPESWKGGTMACGWAIGSGQTPEEALREMERERQADHSL